MGRTCRDRAWQDIADVFETGSKTDQDQSARLREALIAAAQHSVDVYLAVFLTDTERTLRKSIVTKNFGRDNPAIAGACSSPRRIALRP